jgi:hypothetical protein
VRFVKEAAPGAQVSNTKIDSYPVKVTIKKDGSEIFRCVCPSLSYFDFFL